MATAAKQVSGEDLDGQWKKIEELTAANFLHHEIFQWSTDIAEYAEKAPSWWKSDKAKTIRCYNRVNRARLVQSINNTKVFFFNDLAPEIRVLLSEAFDRLIVSLSSRYYVDGKIEKRIRKECFELADIKRKLKKENQKNEAKPAERIEDGKTEDAEESKPAFKCPVHPYPNIGTSLWLMDKKGSFVSAEVIAGKLVESNHEQEILITSGEFIGAFSHHPSAVVRFVLGAGGHLNGWLVVRRLKDDNGGEMSAHAKALIASGECYQIKKSSVKKSHLSSLVAGLPSLFVPSLDDMLVSMDVPRSLIWETEKEDALPADTAPNKASDIMDDKIYQKPDVRQSPAKDDGTQKQIEAKKQAHRDALAELEKITKSLAEIPAMEAQLQQAKEDLRRVREEFSAVIEAKTKLVRDLESRISVVNSAVSKLGIS